MDEHQEKIMRAFAKVLEQETNISKRKTELDAATFLLQSEIKKHETIMADAWAEIEALMNESGEYEVILPDTVDNFKISWNRPKESVKVTSVDAVPDEYVKTEKSPRIREIGEYLNTLREAGRPLPNWAAFEKGKKKLQWRRVKK